jgi:hypothetical protein
MSDLKFPQGCKRIAVCMYGQYRTGDYLEPYFVEFFKNKYNVQVDFFCSSKETRSYLNSPRETKNDTSDLTQEWNKEDLTKKLQNSKLQPKAVNVVSNEEETDLFHGWMKLFNGIADSIRLKVAHELRNNITYDLVFVCRYDVITGPMHLVDRIIHWYDTTTKLTYKNIFGDNLKNFVVAEVMQHNDLIYQSVPGLQDLFFFGSNESVNLLMNEIIRTITHYLNQDNENLSVHDPMVGFDGHAGLNLMFRKNNTGISKCFPVFRNEESVFAGQTETWVDTDRVFITVVREFFDLSLDPTKPETLQAHADAWVEDQ